MAPLIWLMSMAFHLASSGVMLQQDHGAGETCPAITNQLLYTLESCHASSGEYACSQLLRICMAILQTEIAGNLQDWSSKQCLSVM